MIRKRKLDYTSIIGRNLDSKDCCICQKKSGTILFKGKHICKDCLEHIKSIQ